MNRPSILEVVEQYTELKRAGKEWSGLCPFHSEKSPSFTVNEEKSVWYCFSCAEGGDLIAFVEKIENVDFKGALAHLGLADCPRPTRREISKRETIGQASKNLATWALSVSERIGTRMRELGQRAHMARKVLRDLPGANKRLLCAEIQRAEREWMILETLDDDLANPDLILPLWRERQALEFLFNE